MKTIRMSVFMVILVMLCACEKDEVRLNKEGQELRRKRLEEGSNLMPHPNARVRRPKAPESIEYEDYFSNPDVRDINRYQLLLAEGKLKASLLFELANECEDPRIREQMLNSFFSHFSHHNSLIVLDYLDKLESGGVKTAVIRHYAGSVNDPKIAVKVFDWVAACKNREERLAAIGAMGLLVRKLEIDELIGMEQRYTGEIQKMVQEMIGYRYGIGNDAFSHMRAIYDNYGTDSTVTKNYINTLTRDGVDEMAERVEGGEIPKALRPFIVQSVVDQYMREDYLRASSFIDETDAIDKPFLYNRLYAMWLLEDFDQAVDAISELPHSDKQRVGVQAIIKKYNVFGDTESRIEWQQWLAENYPDE